MPSNHLILCHPLLLPPSTIPSISIFSNESAVCIRWPKYWSFSFSISASKEHPGLISFRMDWLDLLAVQEILKSLLQHHISKASILQCSAFFIVQLSHPYMTTGKTKASTKWTFVGKLMPLLFNMLSRLVQNYISVILLWTPDLHVQLPTWCLHSFGFLLVISVGTYAGLSTRLSWSHCSSDSPPQCHKWQNPYSSLLSPKNSQIFLLFLNSSTSFASLYPISQQNLSDLPSRYVQKMTTYICQNYHLIQATITSVLLQKPLKLVSLLNYSEASFWSA